MNDVFDKNGERIRLKDRVSVDGVPHLVVWAWKGRVLLECEESVPDSSQVIVKKACDVEIIRGYVTLRTDLFEELVYLFSVTCRVDGVARETIQKILNSGVKGLSGDKIEWIRARFRADYQNVINEQVPWLRKDPYGGRQE